MPRKRPASPPRAVPASSTPAFRQRTLMGVGGGAVLAAIALVLMVMGLRPAQDVSSTSTQPTPATLQPGGDAVLPQTSTPAPTPLSLGPVNSCVSQPTFIPTLNMGERPIIGTGARTATGFVVVNPATGAIYQDPTWDDAGDLGPYVYDRDGNFYVGPTPRTSLTLNPIEKQNIIYRIDSITAQMAPFLELPAGLPPSSSNPFGIMGMAYDCDTESLYVTSVAGSTAVQQAGRLFRIDLATGQVTDQIEGIDAIGVGVFNGVEGKTLYLASARASELYTVTLDTTGDFSSAPQLLLNTTSLAGGDSRKVRRIQFTPDNRMVWNAFDFDFTLRTASVLEETVYFFIYDSVQGRWELEQVEQIQR